MDGDLRALVSGLDYDQIQDLVESLPPAVAEALAAELGTEGQTVAISPIEQAALLDEPYTERAHLVHLSNKFTEAQADVEAGINRRLIIEMPPRSGKTMMTTLLAPTWIMARHPTWPIVLTSHDPTLATSWGRQIRRWVEEGRLSGVSIRKDTGAAGSWETMRGGSLLSISTRESFTGRGAKVLIIDDPVKDFESAHSPKIRDNLWDWWLSVAQLRLEPPYLVAVTMTRWHQNDLVGRLLSKDYEGDPDDWEVIRMPAIAEEEDPIGRRPGEPLLSPIINETPGEATTRWASVRRSVGSYVWAAMMQQRPSPATGSIFDIDWWRFWTQDPDRSTSERVVYLNPSTDLSGARWLDSWDLAFEGKETSDWVVGQRWARRGPDRILISQTRGRWDFPETVKRMDEWCEPTSLYGAQVHERLVEKKANGAAALSVLKDKISGLKPINPTTSKEVRARSITPECESGNVYLPHPDDLGNEWVADLLSELRNFPHDVHDDQVDALTQALSRLHGETGGSITVPGGTSGPNLHAVPARGSVAYRR